jgi:ribonuclease-3
MSVTQADALATAEQVVGYEFRDQALLTRALTHASIADSRVLSNERLEFLGDAVLGLIICDELYLRFSEWLEGDLTKVKSNLVSRRVCAKVSDEIGLTDMLILGNGIGGQQALPTSLRAAVYESIIGAIYLDGGLAPAREFILRTMKPHLEKCDESSQIQNYKSTLQQYAQRWLSKPPHYEPLDEQGPDHSKCFEVCVVIDGERFPSAWGPSKKEAEQEAAKRALERLRERAPTKSFPAF